MNQNSNQIDNLKQIKENAEEYVKQTVRRVNSSLEQLLPSLPITSFSEPNPANGVIGNPIIIAKVGTFDKQIVPLPSHKKYLQQLQLKELIEIKNSQSLAASSSSNQAKNLIIVTWLLFAITALLCLIALTGFHL